MTLRYDAADAKEIKAEAIAAMRAQQQHRRIALKTPLGSDDLLVQQMMFEECLSQPFTLDLNLLSESYDITPEQLLGQTVTVRFDLPDESPRYFNGIVTRFSSGGRSGSGSEDSRYASYAARVSPWLWFLDRCVDCRIFQHQSVPDIIRKVFQANGFTDFEYRLTATYKPRDYCVQYRETDFNFVSRLMQHEGIFYFSRHRDGKHMIVLGDSYSSFDHSPNYERVPYYPPEETARRERDNISTWRYTGEVRTGKVAMRDFDFTKPRTLLESRLANPASHPLAKTEFYDYPGIYQQTADGDTLSRVRLEELQSDAERVHGGGDVAGLMPGCLFNLIGHPHATQNREYLTESMTLTVVSDEFASTQQAAGAEMWKCSFTALNAQRPYRPPRIARKTRIEGPHTAIVTGPAGEEIYTDQYGRVKVQFHWDREGKQDQDSSCWVRVGTPWAGKTWGAVSIPRIGQEVIVDFLEGDPDQPIIIGSVYNAVTMPPYGLPAAAVISGIKSDSTKGGGGYNEYVMDDTKGNELIREHGQYDKDSTIEHDLREHVLNNRSRDVKVDEKVLIGQDQAIEVDRDRSLLVLRDKSETVNRNKQITVLGGHTENIARTMEINVGSSLSETVAINYSETVGAAMELVVGGALAIAVGAAMSEAVGGTKTETVGISKSEAIGGSKSTSVGASMTQSVDDNKTIKVGKDLRETIGGQHSETVEKEYLLQAKKIQLKAEDELTIKVGSGEIIVKKNGDITINGNKINIKGSGDVTIKGSKIQEN